MSESGPVRIVLQRVSKASVRVGDEVVGEIGPGLLLLVGIEAGDDERDLAAAAEKISDLRVFADRSGAMNLSLREIGGSVLLVSQFTLLADARKGVARRWPEPRQRISPLQCSTAWSSYSRSGGFERSRADSER